MEVELEGMRRCGELRERIGGAVSSNWVLESEGADQDLLCWAVIGKLKP